MNQLLSDEDIIKLYFDRDEAAIKESDSKYGHLLKRISFNILNDNQDSEECVNDTYCKVWDSIPPKRPMSLCGYMGKIVRNISINRWHKGQAQKRGGGVDVILTELEDVIPDGSFQNNQVESAIEVSELTDAVNCWLGELTQDDRAIFLRRYWYGDSLKSLADECSTSANKIGSRLYRLRIKLKSVLEERGISI